MGLRLAPLLISLGSFLAVPHGPGKTADCPAAPARLRYEVVGQFRRSALGFTEGLIFRDGQLYESTGKYGVSALNRIDPSDGSVTRLESLPDQYFGEGLDARGDDLVQLTWKEKTALRHTAPLVSDTAGSHPPRELPYPRDGWGLTHDDAGWIASEGTSLLHRLSPIDLHETATIAVRAGDSSPATPPLRLNELEYAEGRVFANTYPTDQVVRIDPRTGCIDGTLDLSTLRDRLDAHDLARILASPESVLNGIAYDPDARLFYLTGKDWPIVFRVRITG